MSLYSVEKFSILNERNELISAGASLGVFGLTRKLKKKNNKKNIKEKLIKKIKIKNIFSVETRFHLGGYINKQNWLILGLKKPTRGLSKLMHILQVTVWCR